MTTRIELSDCQAVGCNAFALPWPVSIAWDEIEIEVYLCRRCEIEVNGVGSPTSGRSAAMNALVGDSRKAES